MVLILDFSINTRFNYHPNYRLSPRVDSLPPFPLIPTREDWPYEREVIGDWSVTPFGGRGRWNLDTMVEIEGLVNWWYQMIVTNFSNNCTTIL